MAKTNDFTKAFQDMFDGKLFNMAPAEDMIKEANEFGAKFNKIALEAAEKSADLSYAWAKDSMDKMEAFTKVQKDPADVAKLSTDVISEQAQATPERVAQFAEVAKTAQMATVELMMAAGKNMQAEVAAATKKATAKAA